jgi:hypothetical protein
MSIIWLLRDWLHLEIIEPTEIKPDLKAVSSIRVEISRRLHGDFQPNRCNMPSIASLRFQIGKCRTDCQPVVVSGWSDSSPIIEEFNL